LFQDLRYLSERVSDDASCAIRACRGKIIYPLIITKIHQFSLNVAADEQLEREMEDEDAVNIPCKILLMLLTTSDV
jgi:hypothetical protein